MPGFTIFFHHHSHDIISSQDLKRATKKTLEHIDMFEDTRCRREKE